MRRHLSTIVLLFGLGITPGCSIFIVSGGKDPPRFTSTDTRESVSRKLDKPRAVEVYSAPMPLGAVPEVAELLPGSQKIARSITNLVKIREDFLIRRWIRTPGPDDGTGIAMLS